MSFIQFQCYACSQVLKVGGDKAGKKAKCIKCGTILTIPVESVAPAPAARPAAQPKPTRPVAPVEEELPVAEFEEELEAELEEEPVAELDERPARPARAEFVDDEEPRSSRGKRRAEDDYDDRPRGRRRDEEEDDRPRSKRRDEEEDAPRRRRDEDDYDDDRPRGRRDADDDDYEPRKADPRAQWARVKLAFLLIFIGACVTGGGLLLDVIGQIMDTILIIGFLTGSRSLSGTSGIVLHQIAEPLFLCATITAMVGYVFCMLGPNKRGSMGLAIAVLAVAGVDVLMVLIFKFPMLYSTTGVTYLGFFMYWFVQVLMHLLNAAQFLLCVLVMRAFALARKDKGLAGQAMGLVSLAGAVAGLGLFTDVFSYVSQSQAMAWVTLIFKWLTTLAFIGLIIWYTIAMWNARDMVGRRSRGDD